jgi:hypothetical protein
MDGWTDGWIKQRVLHFSASFQHMMCTGVAIAAFGSIHILTTILGNERISKRLYFLSFPKLDWNSVLFLGLKLHCSLVLYCCFEFMVFTAV